jgi:hypothetical protein
MARKRASANKNPTSPNSSDSSTRTKTNPTVGPKGDAGRILTAVHGRLPTNLSPRGDKLSLAVVVLPIVRAYRLVARRCGFVDQVAHRVPPLRKRLLAESRRQ